jgi:hypothetical protein
VVQFTLLAREFSLPVLVTIGGASLLRWAVELLAIPVLGLMGAALGQAVFAVIALPTLLLLAVRRNTLSRTSARHLGVIAAILPLVFALYSLVLAIVGR